MNDGQFWCAPPAQTANDLKGLWLSKSVITTGWGSLCTTTVIAVDALLRGRHRAVCHDPHATLQSVQSNTNTVFNKCQAGMSLGNL
jgi:hypothetical protein